MEKRIIQFSPPDIGEAEIAEVVDTLRSGWITTGPKTKRFEAEIAAYCGTNRALCLNSATAGLELALRLLGIGEGDEVITTPLTFAATANVILHVGAKPVFADVLPGGFHIDPVSVARAVTPRTKAVIPVDYGGWCCDYDTLETALESKKSLWNPAMGTLQERFSRPVLIDDAAHSFGAEFNGKKAGSLGNMAVFSFHAVKNLTTAEGGAITVPAGGELDDDGVFKTLRLYSLHGQSKDALAKFQAGGWKYSIDLPGYKFNMTDIAAAIGLAQLRRYESEILPARAAIRSAYDRTLSDVPGLSLPPFPGAAGKATPHLYPVMLGSPDEYQRAAVIANLAAKGISANVHFIPLTMQPAYTRLGYRVQDTPEAYNSYAREISLPVHGKMGTGDAEYVAEKLRETVQSV
jgi:dTDP-4-amino-4,6-dideoxygalactose transaminase